MDEILLNLLAKTNLGKNESMVYLAVLKLGSATASSVAGLTNLKRPNVYNILGELVAKKYLSLEPNTKVLHYVATDPKALSNELDNAARDFKEMLPYLENIHHKSGRPIVSYYTGVEGAKIVFEQIRRPKEAFYATSVGKVMEHMPNEVDRWQRIYLKGKARPGGYHLLSNTEKDREYAKVLSKSGQLVKFLSETDNLEMDFVLYDGVVVLTSFEEEIVITVIESASLYQSLKSIFLLAWQSAKSKY